MKAQVYKDPRPEEYFDRFHERVAHARARLGLRGRARRSRRCYAWIAFRARSIDSENVPAERPGDPRAEPLLLHGPLLPRRRSCAARCSSWPSRSSSQRPLQFDLHARRRLPGAARLRATRRRSSPPTTILGRGGTIAMYCEGGRSRTGKLAEQAKRGIGRLALETGAPVVPVAIYGSAARAQLEAAAVPEGDRAVRRADALRAGREPDARPAAGGRRRDLRRDPRALRRPRALGRRGVVQRLREQRRGARAPRPRA